jgi:peptidoglycan/xylan/chitin deacetylase (PgdA/CDA1 family)
MASSGARFSMRYALYTLCVMLSLIVSRADDARAAAPTESGGIPILVYHRFGPVVADSMTVTTPVFEQQLAWLRDHDYRIVPLRAAVDALREGRVRDLGRAITITVDDGHRTVYTELFPLIKRYRLPVTLFIYPSAISNASYAMTWEQIAEMVRSGLVDVQSHTYWHPNFRREKARLKPAEYRTFVENQLLRSKKVLVDHFHSEISMLAWPFGIVDPELEQMAREAGYVAAFTLERRPALPDADLLALPRYLMTDQDRGARFAAIAAGGAR